MQSGSHSVRSTLWMALAGISVLNLAVLNAAKAPQKFLDENNSFNRAPTEIKIQRASDAISHGVQRVGRDFAKVVLPAKSLNNNWKTYVGNPAVRVIKSHNFGKNSYGFLECGSSALASNFQKPVWGSENPADSDSQTINLRPGAAVGFRHLVQSQGFFGLHASADIVPLSRIKDSCEYSRVGLHGEFAYKDYFLQLNFQRNLNEWKGLFKKETYSQEQKGPRVFAPIYTRLLMPLIKTNQKVALEAGYAVQSNQEAKNRLYVESYWVPKFFIAPIVKKFFEYVTFNLGLRAVALSEDFKSTDAGLSLKQMTWNIAKLKTSITPLFRMNIQLAGSASTAESTLGRFSALSYFYNLGLAERNFTGDQNIECFQKLKESTKKAFDGLKKVAKATPQSPQSPQTPQTPQSE